MQQYAWQFRLKHALVATAVLGAILMSFLSLRGLYEIHGAIGEAFFGMLLILFLLGAGLCAFFSRLRALSLVAVIVVCVWFGFLERSAKRRLMLLKAEVPRIIAYLENHKTHHGSYPADLAGYEFEHADLTSYVRYERQPTWYPYCPYVIRYQPTRDEGIAHWYSPKSGFWYEDD
jgi:hypothetical protein